MTKLTQLPSANPIRLTMKAGHVVTSSPLFWKLREGGYKCEVSLGYIAILQNKTLCAKWEEGSRHIRLRQSHSIYYLKENVNCSTIN